MNHQEIRELTRTYEYIGVTYHTLKTGAVPSKKSITGYEPAKWEALLSYAKSTYDFEPEDHFKTVDTSSNGKALTKTFLHLKNGISLYNSCDEVAEFIYHSGSDQAALKDLEARFDEIILNKAAHSIGLIRSRFGRLDITFFDYKLPKHSLIPYLDQATQNFHENMQQALRQEVGSGLFLLYGRPGTGKTSFLKDVISKVPKKALFISPSFSRDLTSPELITLLMEHPNSILIIEDAETVIMERKADNSSSVSNLLNLTDGFLADFLNLNIICTFNTNLKNIDEALLRDGRLKGMHEFAKVQPERAQQIASLLGRDINPDKPVTIAEICSSQCKSENYKSGTIGF